MKKIILLSILSFLAINQLSAQELSFQYDNAGNQIVREWICVNCPYVNSTAPTNEVLSKNSDKTLIDKSLSDDLLGHKLSVYPNPVTEILNVKWSDNDAIYVQSIDVFTLTGVRLFHKSFSEKDRETTISFIELAAGSYLLKANYSDNKQEVVKLIKQ
ncbi:T9SS type A sorting domain-containing protein [Pedobacter alpinus]|uniref:T9SS type A sorting domain-containing protein n=1 Tax=Pedobacter alpinus TaxID=1590643 RepID=A0ABW5TMS3_9SPHI